MSNVRDSCIGPTPPNAGFILFCPGHSTFWPAMTRLSLGLGTRNAPSKSACGGETIPETSARRKVIFLEHLRHPPPLSAVLRLCAADRAPETRRTAAGRRCSASQPKDLLRGAWGRLDKRKAESLLITVPAVSHLAFSADIHHVADK